VRGVGARGLVLAVFLLSPFTMRAETAVSTLPPVFDASEWSALLEKYVDPRGLVAYARWKANVADRARLAGYLAKFGRSGAVNLTNDQTIAMLINAYNACIIAAVLDRYPVDGIRSIPGAFTAETHSVGGKSYSLDEIEHTAVRRGGYRVHATIVCASRSCPPLDRRAYAAEDLLAHEDERMRAWMGRRDFFRFEPAENTAFVPKYFDWYRTDFEKDGIPRILAAYAPDQFRGWLARGDFKVAYLNYDWSLNDLGRSR
jgi:hypothetical protein